MRSGYSVITPPPRTTHVKADPCHSAHYAGLRSFGLGRLVDAVASASQRALERVPDLGKQVERLELQREEVLHQESLRASIAEGAHLGGGFIWRA